MTAVEINTYISFINTDFDDYITYIDTISFTDGNQKEYSTLESVISNAEKSNYNSIQHLEEIKKNSLNKFALKLIQDSTMLNICFDVYGEVNDDNLDKLINDNDLMAYDRTDIDPNSPVIPRGTEIVYYK